MPVLMLEESALEQLNWQHNDRYCDAAPVAVVGVVVAPSLVHC
jgi:hypothetical protein